MISIAIDGPSGAGKSTIARAVAGELGFTYVDTGALYRAVGLFAERSGADPEDARRVEELLPFISLELIHRDGAQHVLLNGEDVTNLLRTPKASVTASVVAAIPAVRSFLIDLQRDLARSRDVIMDGRDIGTVILPHAQIKIFLTASAEDRARRRYEELVARGQNVSYEEVLRDVKSRDQNDSTRATAPLTAASDAITVDTTGNTLDESVKLLSMLIRNKLRQN